MNYFILEQAEAYINSNIEFAKFNVLPATVSIWDPNPRTGRKSLVVGLLLVSELRAYPNDLVAHILRITLWLQATGCADDILFTCKSKGPFSHGYEMSTRTMIQVNIFSQIPEKFDVEYVKSVIGKQVESVQCFWPRYFDKERLEDFPELEDITHAELHDRYRVPYRRGFNDDLRFDKNPQLEIPKTYEELERLFPQPFKYYPNP